MESTPRDQAEWRQFDYYCKLVLKHAAIDFLRAQKFRRKHETTMDAIPKTMLDKLSTTDQYPSDDYVFHSHGYDLRIQNESVAEAFAELPALSQSILILRFTLEMTDQEIGTVLEMPRHCTGKANKSIVHSAEETICTSVERRNSMNRSQEMEQLSLSLIRTAKAGDVQAVEQVLRYQESYINQLCTRTLYDEYGQPHVCVDVYMKHCLENQLVRAIVTAD